MKASVAGIIGSFVGLFIFAVLVPSMLEMFYDVTYSTWPASLQTVWLLVPLMLVISGLISVVYAIKGSSGSASLAKGIARIIELIHNKKGAISVGVVVSMVVTLIVFVALAPTLISQLLTGFNTTDTTPFGATTAVPYITTVVLLGSLLPMFFVLAYLINLIYQAVRSR